MSELVIISGGQTGVDQAALRAAKSLGIKTGGWMPQGWTTEDGPRKDFEALYGMVECDGWGYPARTRANVLDSQGILIIARSFEMLKSSGTSLTINAAIKHRRPYYLIADIFDEHKAKVIDWMMTWGIYKLNVAGNRESKDPGIGVWAEEYLTEIFSLP